MQRRGGSEPAQPDGQQAGHLVGPDDGPRDRLLDSATVTEQNDVRREDVEQALQVARFRRPLERLERFSGLGRGNGPARPARRDVLPRPVRDLADRGLALVDCLGDLLVADDEHLAQHEHRPLGRGERLKHQQHRHRDAVGQLGVLGHVGRGEHRLGQPGADVRLLAAAERAQPGEGLAGGDLDEVRTPVPHHAEIDARPPQPGLLEDVLRVGGRAEHLVGDREQQVAVGNERLRGGVRMIVAAAVPRVMVGCRLWRAGHGWLLFALRLCHPSDAGPAAL